MCSLRACHHSDWQHRYCTAMLDVVTAMLDVVCGYAGDRYCRVHLKAIWNLLAPPHRRMAASQPSVPCWSRCGEAALP